MVIFIKNNCESVKEIKTESELNELCMEHGVDLSNINLPLFFVDISKMKDKIHDLSCNFCIENLNGLFFCDLDEFHKNYVLNQDKKLVTIGNSLFDRFYGVNLCKATILDVYVALVLSKDEKGNLIN